MKNILVTTSSYGVYDKSPIQYVENANYSVILNPLKRKLVEDEAIALMTEYDPVGVIAGIEPLSERVLRSAAKLKAISRCGIGMDNVDLEAAKNRSIRVANTPDGPTIAVAELTIGLMLSLLRKLHISDARIRDGNWYRPMGNLLSGKTIGIIGCGRIGSKVAEFLKPFGCKVIGYDPNLNGSVLWESVNFERLLIESDIVSLHLPYNSDTHHLIDNAMISRMKKESFLINASRGGLVDEAALYENLVNEKLAGAALDCFELEPYEGMLCSLDSVLLTGHIGSYAVEGRIAMEVKAAENMIRLLKP